MAAERDPPSVIAWPTRGDLRALADPKDGPLLSIYVPFRASFAGHVENARRYGQAVARACDRLESHGMATERVADWAERLTQFQRRLRTPTKPPQGIGVFLGTSLLRAYKLATPPSERVVVADCFALRELARQVRLIWAAPPSQQLLVPLRREKLALELDRILAGARQGKIKRLWLRDGAAISGRIDPDNGRIISAAGGDGDVLDALAACVLRSGGEVLVVASEAIPGPVNAAAELR